MKKFLLATTLILTLVLGGCQYLPWNKTIEPASEEVATPEIDYSKYNKVLDDYEKVAKGTLSTGIDVNPLASQVNSSQGFYTDVVYHKTDLNNDGVDELLLALEMKGGGKSLLDIRTLKGEKVIRLTNQENHLELLGERMTVGILPDNSLLYRGVGTATSHIYAHYQFSEDGQSLVKAKEAQELADLGVGSPISLETLSWQSVSDKIPGGASADKGTADTSSSTNQHTSGKMDINAIKNGDFSSIEGRWSKGNGGEDLVFSKDGLVAPEQFTVDLAESEIVNEFLRARYSGPSFGVFIQFVPAGVRIPDETSMDGIISDASDISKDRIIYRASFPVHNKPEQFLYRVE